MNNLPIGTVLCYKDSIDLNIITLTRSDRYYINGSEDYILFSDLENYTVYELKEVNVSSESYDFNSLYPSDTQPLIYADTDTVQPFTLPIMSPFYTKEEVEYVLNSISKEIVEKDYRFALDLLKVLRIHVDRLESSLRKELDNDQK